MLSDDEYKRLEERIRNKALLRIKKYKRDILLNYWKFKYFSYTWKIINKRIERLEAMMESLIPEDKLYIIDDFDYIDEIPFDVLHEYNNLDSKVDICSSIANVIEFDCDLAYDFFKDAVRDYYTEMKFIPIV